MSEHRMTAPLPSPASGWTSSERTAAVVTLVLAAALPLVSHVAQPTLPEVDAALRWSGEHPDLASWTKVLDLLAVPFLAGAALVYVLLARPAARRLASAGGVLLGCGLIGLAAVEGHEALLVTLAGDDRTDVASLAAAGQQTSPPAVVMLLLLVVGTLPGMLLLALALYRSAAIPRRIAVLLPVPLLWDVVVTEGFATGPHWVSHALALLVSCRIGWAVLSERQMSKSAVAKAVPV